MSNKICSKIFAKFTFPTGDAIGLFYNMYNGKYVPNQNQGVSRVCNQSEQKNTILCQLLFELLVESVDLMKFKYLYGTYKDTMLQCGYLTKVWFRQIELIHCFNNFEYLQNISKPVKF